jgi:hypothetical protein
MKLGKPRFQSLLVLLPPHLVHAWRGSSLQSVKAVPKQCDGQVVESQHLGPGCSAPFMSAVRHSAFADRPDPESGKTEVSRFSCMQFLHVPGVSDYAKPIPELAMDRSGSCCLPFLSTGSALRMRFSKLNTQPTDAFTLRLGPHGLAPQNSRSRWFASPFL